MSYEATSTEELLAVAMGGRSTEEMLAAISDDLNVLWLAQQSQSLEPDEFGFFLARLQARADIAAELARRAKEEAAASAMPSADHIPEEFWRRLEALEERAGSRPAVKLRIVKPESESGPFAGGPAS